ncbi:MAG: NADH-quinone oxidoreductase subunit J [Thaumarchaeota archaeon]|nr:NADH-quinone oxidoreductase subunit J [Nitrososphaerota archaeon]
MYPIDYGSMVELGAFLALALIAVAFSILSVLTKDYVYSALSLGIVGISFAGLFATLGYGYIATFHLLVYVGAAVTFIAFSVVMMRELPEDYRSLKFVALAIGELFAILISASLLSGVAPVQLKPMPSLSELADTIVSTYWFPLLVLALSLATVIIEGLVIARREGR